MSKYFYLLLISIFQLQSCSKKEVQLALIEIEGIHEIQNHSSVWIFFETNNQDTIAVLNKNNKLLNTHWIFNIDRRLPMKKIVPILEDLQENRNKESMHKKEGMLNYFSYADKIANKISLLYFPTTTFIKNSQKYTDYKEQLSKGKIIELKIENHKIFIAKEPIEKDQLKEYVKTIASRDSIEPIVFLKYRENIPFQDYLSLKTFLQNQGVQVGKTEYIYTVE